MSEIDFKKEYLGERIVDEEYQFLLNLWLEYRKQTDHLPVSKNKEAYRIHRLLFGNVHKGEKYQQAKMESLRIIGD